MTEEFFDKAHDVLPFGLTIEDTYGYLFDKYRTFYNAGRLFKDDFDDYFKICRRLKGTKYEKEVRDLLHLQIDNYFQKSKEIKPGPSNWLPGHMIGFLEVLEYLNN